MQRIAKMNPLVEDRNGERIREKKNFSKQTYETDYGDVISQLIRPAIVVLTSARQMVQLPSENEVFGDSGENIMENPEIKPETSINLKVGFKAGLYQVNKRTISVSASGFIRVTFFENLGKIKSIGFDAELRIFIQ